MLLTTLLALAAQAPDTVRADTTRAARLADVTVTVTRTAESLARLAASAAVLDAEAIGGARATLGLDEALNGIPGVYIGNRYNFSLDQRVTIRGFGSRAPFGTRGVKILLDGIPQTTPDGQSQFTNLELATIHRVQVLRGSASSLYGNAAGGVILLESVPLAAQGARGSGRLAAGSFGLLKWQAAGQFGGSRLAGGASVSRTTWDGFRAQSRAEIRQVTSSLRYRASERTTLTLRFNAGDAPRAGNPGALTFAEYAANPDSAAPANLRRRADKDSRQVQGALGLEHVDGNGNRYDALIFAYARDVDNATATPSPPATPDGGTYVRLNREVIGVRLSHDRRFRPAPESPRFTAGMDAQAMGDDRRNWRSVGGERTETLLLDQRERVRQIGPFLQAIWTPTPRWTFSAGTRYDWFRFTATDRYFQDGEDNSGQRTMSAWSGSGGMSYLLSAAVIPYLHVGTSFETPTTSELAIRPGEQGGFAPDLEPQRATTVEAGARGEVGGLTWSAAVFRAGLRDAIVQWREIGGRAFFRNAGGITKWGAELGLGWPVHRAVRLDGAYTWGRYRFTDYSIQQGTTTQVLDGNTLPGLPAHFARLALAVRPVAALHLTVEQTLSGALWTDDLNTPERRVDHWGAGVTDLRAQWSEGIGQLGLRPFAAVNNLWNRRYVSSVIINGAGGRVLEPAPGRNLYVGIEVRGG
jgi:iron complex outermembrane receptor protein